MTPTHQDDAPLPAVPDEMTIADVELEPLDEDAAAPTFVLAQPAPRPADPAYEPTLHLDEPAPEPEPQPGPKVDAGPPDDDASPSPFVAPPPGPARSSSSGLALIALAAALALAAVTLIGMELGRGEPREAAPPPSTAAPETGSEVSIVPTPAPASTDHIDEPTEDPPAAVEVAPATAEATETEAPARRVRAAQREDAVRAAETFFDERPEREPRENPAAAAQSFFDE